MDNGKASLEEGPDNEREGGNTYPFYCAIHEEVEGVRGNDDGIARSATRNARTSLCTKGNLRRERHVHRRLPRWGWPRRGNGRRSTAART
jgi:hypothetical protein